MNPDIPLLAILERMRREQSDAQPALRLYAPEPSDPLYDPRDHERPQREAGEKEQPERGVLIIDFAI